MRTVGLRAVSFYRQVSATRTDGGVAVRPLAERIDRPEFNSMTRVAIAAACWRRKSPGRKRGRPENGRPYEGWKMSKVQMSAVRTAAA